uniref:Uncharacterized protein n=1 Tax=Schizaphis graminum TaxID=13262 RepID=A0A2S2NHP2_SCHGA
MKFNLNFDIFRINSNFKHLYRNNWKPTTETRVAMLMIHQNSHVRRHPKRTLGNENRCGTVRRNFLDACCAAAAPNLICFAVVRPRGVGKQHVDTTPSKVIMHIFIRLATQI